ncbi:MAG: MBL fold metallo-hydrolase [Candidatus Hodarchaeales archaeon]|jgi:ribonuclease BN (tRNA processing enzyme)
MSTQIKFFGVRGSAPIADKNFLKYGGNTSSLTVRTPENSLLFLDAGSGLYFAQEELNEKAENIWLLLSHTHADHINGLGLSNIVQLAQNPFYSNKKLRIVGPRNVTQGMKKYYDADRIWPVSFNPSNREQPNLPDIDYENILEFNGNFQEIEIDKSSTLVLHEGNHPVNDGVILFRINFKTSNGLKSLVYATDNEFRFNHWTNSFSDLDIFKESYVKFIDKSDLLIADAQFTLNDYDLHRGFGHSYPEEVLELANKANVKKVILTHHHSYQDDIQDKRENDVKAILKRENYQFDAYFAKEKTEISI